MGKLFLFFVLSLIAISVIHTMGITFPWFINLPGDFTKKIAGTLVYIPLTTALVIGVSITVLFNLFSRK